MKTPSIFISYAHADEEWRQSLVVHLQAAVRQGRLELWDDRRIGVADEWSNELRAAVGRANVAVLLVSADFLASDFINDQEIPRLLERQADEGLVILPVIVRPCD